MKIYKKVFLTGLIIFTVFASVAQRGNSQLQISAQLSVPTGDLSKIVKAGTGYSVKGLLGIGEEPQQITLEIGNSFFNLKGKYITGAVSSYYSSWPLYLGYRRYYKNIYTETQLGIAFNTFQAFRTDTIASIEQSKTYLAGAAGIGYQLNKFDFGIRYQYSPIKNDADIAFFAFRAAYSFSVGLKKSTEQP